ncbi:hypothetical protein ROHU_026390 [Labeo rohita]|uniref:Uncharacterized protein n=1 Tax=Labeo rohita TaxID=84645 RepID=A0A498MH36_LABRO|nr:hypothetical protein ROHU_026390 [Labeo rohita]
MKTRWHRREGRADWSQQGEASGIITGSVRSGDAMSPYRHRHRPLCLPLSHGLSCSRPVEAGSAKISKSTKETAVSPQVLTVRPLSDEGDGEAQHNALFWEVILSRTPCLPRTACLLIAYQIAGS